MQSSAENRNAREMRRQNYQTAEQTKEQLPTGPAWSDATGMSARELCLSRPVPPCVRSILNPATAEGQQRPRHGGTGLVVSANTRDSRALLNRAKRFVPEKSPADVDESVSDVNGDEVPAAAEFGCMTAKEKQFKDLHMGSVNTRTRLDSQPLGGCEDTVSQNCMHCDAFQHWHWIVLFARRDNFPYVCHTRGKCNLTVPDWAGCRSNDVSITAP